MPNPSVLFVAVSVVTAEKIEQDDGMGNTTTIGYRVTASLTPEPAAYIESVSLYRQLHDNSDKPDGELEYVDEMFQVGMTPPAYFFEGTDWAWTEPTANHHWWYVVKAWSYKYKQTDGKKKI